MSKMTFKLVHPMARKNACQAVMGAPDGHVCIIQEATRSIEQNRLLWELLTRVAEQVEWYGQKLTNEEWKDVFSAALKRQKVVPGLDGGFVVLGQRTSKMGKQEFSELLELIQAFGAERGVEFGEPDLPDYQYPEAG